MQYYGQKVQTKVLDCTLNPIYNEQLHITIPYNKAEIMHHSIIIKVFDEDLISKDFLGSAIIDVQEGISKGYSILFFLTKYKALNEFKTIKCLYLWF